MFSLDIKRMQEKKQREQAWIKKKHADDSIQVKEARIQRLYGKSSDDMYEEYSHRVGSWATSSVDKSPEWKDSYGQLTSAAENPMVWPRDPAKELGHAFMDVGKYIPHGQYRGGGTCLQSPTPPDPRKPFDHGTYDDPIESPFRRRAKPKEIQPPLRYNTIVRDYPDRPHDFDSTWTEPKPLPQWRFPDPTKWTAGEFGVTFNSRDSMTALFEGIASQKHAPSIAASERFVPCMTARPKSPSSPTKRAVARAKSAPQEKLYMNSLLSVHTDASLRLLDDLAHVKPGKAKHALLPDSPETTTQLAR
ncbi:Aste57867_21145 [Aphanomyces stellatus]|uniref:Aste57867_21145 protein n=1 Tax=Aphanomyces stellatus TaxID=120398 RepID=A0A485LGV7_9STRA|nr:hypothetical protein As57867_021077 [Aphanomyces stellatus]VFT97819.1 Aste57867_21145 [Aphanomyces stellatus]